MSDDEDEFSRLFPFFFLLFFFFGYEGREVVRASPAAAKTVHYFCYNQRHYSVLKTTTSCLLVIKSGKVKSDGGWYAL